MLIPIKTILAAQAIEFKSSDFPKDYEGKLTSRQYTDVMYLFFKKISNYIHKGGSITLPIGSFYLKKQYLSPNKQYISHAATKRKRVETGDFTAVVYQENDYYYRIAWAKAKIHPNLLNYKFKFSWKNERLIESFREVLDLNVDILK